MITGGVPASEHSEAPGNEAIDQDPHRLPEASDAFYRAALPLSHSTLNYLAGVIRRGADGEHGAQCRGEAESGAEPGDAEPVSGARRVSPRSGRR